MLNSLLIRIRRGILDAGGKGASRVLLLGLWLLGRIFMRHDESEWSVPLDRPSRSIRYLKHLGRLKRREGTIAYDLGSLAKELHRQGLRDQARRFAKGAFDRWQKARACDRRLRRSAEEALQRHGV
jgi:hypothetical protein